MTVQASRRSFLQGAGAGAAALAIGFDPSGALAKGWAKTLSFNPFVKISQDGSVTALVKHFEGGQGAATGLASLIAEEMNMKMEDIHFEFAPSDPSTYNNLAFGPFQGTGGSTAMSNSFMQYRKAGAAARAMLLRAAARKLDVSEADLSLQDGVISGGGKSIGIGAIAATAAYLPVPTDPPLKPASEWTIIGNAQTRRLDTPDKIDGSGKFATDVHLDNQMVCAIKRSPRFGGKVASFDDSAAKEVPGFIMAKALPNSAGVVAYAEHTWAAFQARDALEVEWDNSAAESRSSDAIKAEMMAAVNAAPEYTASKTALSETEGALAGAAQIVERDFYLPYLAHAPMEPVTATIEPTADGGAIMHDGAQAPTANHGVMNSILEIPMEKLQVNTLYAGGFFGRRFTPASDYQIELSLAFAITDRTRPVKLAWSREDDITGGLYRPAFAHKVRVGLDADGKIIGWDHRLSGQSIFKGTGFEAMLVHNGVDHSSVEGVVDTPYTIPAMHVGLTDAKQANTVCWWRSVGHSHTAFVMESMMDECAAAAGIDPVEYRLSYLDGDDPKQARLAGVLRLAAEHAMSEPLALGQGRGVAVHHSFGSYVAEICEVSTGRDGSVQIERITAAVDCGIAVNPDVVKAQIEGGIGYGIGHAMRNAITFDGGEVVEQNFPDYEPLRIGDIKAIDVHIVASAEPPTGVGEPGTPPAAPALANAIAALGKRVTHLPMTEHGVEFA